MQYQYCDATVLISVHGSQLRVVTTTSVDIDINGALTDVGTILLRLILDVQSGAGMILF